MKLIKLLKEIKIIPYKIQAELIRNNESFSTLKFYIDNEEYKGAIYHIMPERFITQELPLEKFKALTRFLKEKNVPYQYSDLGGGDFDIHIETIYISIKNK
jgi:hypothetical protein